MPSTIILSDNGATSGSAGLKTSGGNDGVLLFQTTTSGGTPTTAISISNTQVVTYTNQPTYTGGTANGVLYLNGSKAVTSGTALVFDGNNLGIGVTPINVPISGYKGLEIGSSGSGFFCGANDFNALANTYYSSGWKYATTAAAGKYQITGNTHNWYIAPSGTAGNAISFTQAMTLDASGNLGLGDTSPSTSLAGSVRGITIKSTADSQIRLFNNTSGSTATDGLLMSINNALDGYFWNYENANIYFGTNNTVRASVTSAGNFSLAGGNLVLAAGYGIDFSANSHAGGMQTELLNDYEEGWWTPVLSMGSNSASPNSTNYRGRYIKIGNWVTFNMYVRFNTTGFSGAGSCQVSLPFTNGSSGNEQYGSFDISYVSDIFTGIPSGSFVGGYIINNASSLILTFSSPNGSETQISNAYLQKAASVGIMISGSYSTINSP